MTWIVLGGVVVGLLCFVGARTQHKNSARELGKGAGNAGRACYKNRGSRQRRKKVESP